MRAHHPTLLSFSLRCLLIFGLSVSSVTLLTELGPAAFTAHVVLAATGNGMERETPPPGSASTYRWNLNDDGLPLISLPDRIDGGLDQALTYSMDQFEFPLFQSLYYNERAGKYILMVIPKDELNSQTGKASGLMDRHAEFIDLNPVGDDGHFQANRGLSLRLKDKSGVKVLSTGDGTVYTFAALADSELHCRQINDPDGAVLNLKYTSDASLETITDDRGRTITFSYTHDYLSSVAQTWGGNARRLRKS